MHLLQQHSAAQVYAYLLPLLFLRIPLSLIVAILWNAITYFSIGLTLSAGRQALPCTDGTECLHAWLGVRQG